MMMLLKSLPPVTAAALTIQFPAPAAQFPEPAARFSEPAAWFPAPAARFTAAQSASTSNLAQFPSVSDKGKLRL